MRFPDLRENGQTGSGDGRLLREETQIKEKKSSGPISEGDKGRPRGQRRGQRTFK